MAESIIATHGMENVLGLENPETYRCIVWQYHVSHSWLEILLETEGLRIFVDFGMVSHFEGALRWQGAKFRTASEEAHMEFLEKVSHNAKDIEIQRKYSCLYLVDTPLSQVKILAMPRVMLTNQWHEYEEIVGNKLLERISTDIETGQPCIVSTKWHYGLKQEFQSKTLLSLILEQLEKGYTQSDILTRFTWLEPEDIQAALVYARRAISQPSDTKATE
jgi:hypothetical protein